MFSQPLQIAGKDSAKRWGVHVSLFAYGLVACVESNACKLDARVLLCPAWTHDNS